MSLSDQKFNSIRSALLKSHFDADMFLEYWTTEPTTTNSIFESLSVPSMLQIVKDLKQLQKKISIFSINKRTKIIFCINKCQTNYFNKLKRILDSTEDDKDHSNSSHLKVHLQAIQQHQFQAYERTNDSKDLIDTSSSLYGQRVWSVQEKQSKKNHFFDESEDNQGQNQLACLVKKQQ